MAKIQFDTPFNTPYIASYIEPQQEENKNEFVTDYVVKVADTVITIETRPKRKKFKSRLVEK